MDASHINRIATSTFRRAVLLGFISALLMGFTVVSTVGSTDLGTEQVDLSVNTFVDDADVTLANNDIIIITAAATASGDNPLGQEADDTLPAVNNDLNLDYYAYTFELKESGATAWQSGENFRIRVYGYDASGPTTALLATLYTQQGTADGTVEGVTVTVDLGSTTTAHDHFDIIIDRQ